MDLNDLEKLIVRARLGGVISASAIVRDAGWECGK
jgi:hypothetical protein